MGIDLRNAKPQKLTAELAQDAALLITMGRGDDCPYVPGRRLATTRSKDQGIDSVRQTREDIRERVFRCLRGRA